MARTITVRLVVAVDEAGDWAVAAVKDGSRSEAVADALAELSGEHYSEVYEVNLPIAAPRRPVRTIKVAPEALQLVIGGPVAGSSPLPFCRCFQYLRCFRIFREPVPSAHALPHVLEAIVMMGQDLTSSEETEISEISEKTEEEGDTEATEISVRSSSASASVSQPFNRCHEGVRPGVASTSEVFDDTCFAAEEGAE